MSALNKKIINQKGFTLLEVLAVIAIIGILASIVIIALNPGRQFAQARNAQRKSDLAAIHTAMNLYFVKNLEWPATVPDYLVEICDTGNQPPGHDIDCADMGLIDLSALVPDYLASIPVDPQGPELGLLNKTYAAEGGTGYFVGLNSPTDLAVMAERSTEYNLPLVAIGTTTDTGNFLEPDVFPYAYSGNTNDYADTADDSDFAFGTNPWSISIWFYPTNDVTNYQTLYNDGGPSIDRNVLIYYKAFGQGTVYLKDAGGNSTAAALGSFNTNAWNNLMVIYDGSYVNVYKDNVHYNYVALADNYNPSGGIEIGGLSSYSQSFLGKIDEVLVFNGKALNGSERSAIYNAGAGARGDITQSPWSTNLVAGWHFDEGSGGTAQDFSGNGHTLSLHGSPSFVSSPVAVP